jgi:hypothetical protein
MPHLPLVAWILLAPGAAAIASVVGDVVGAPGAEGGTLAVRRDAGDEVLVHVAPATVFLRTRPGATSLEGAQPVLPAAIAVGDRVLVQGPLSTDGKTLRARRVVVMARADVAAQREAERQDWRRGGLAGVVTSVDARNREIVLRVSRPAGPPTVVLATAGRKVRFLRYAPGSVRFADTRPSSFEDIAPGDQVRALGDPLGPDGARVAAETIVSGAFRVVRGTAAAVDAAGGTLLVDTRARGADPVSVLVGPDTLVRRLPPPMVARLLSGAAPDPDEALERLPPATLDRLHKGEEIAVLGPRTEDPAALRAIKLVAWVPPEDAARGAGRRDRRPSIGGQADPFADLLDIGGEEPW